jgi:glycerol uptake facilitator-like aquaporin
VDLRRRLVAEALGTCLLLVAVVGSGTLGERLAQGNAAVALLANALASAAALFALIEWLAPLSGSHFNPVVSLALACRGDITRPVAAAYVATQAVAAVAGVGLASAMFGAPVFALSGNVRTGADLWLSECVFTFGLVGVVWVCSRLRPSSVAAVVAAYVGSGFWMTPTGFGNPAVALARALTGSFSGIRLVDVPAFVAAELLGAVLAIQLFGWLLPVAAPAGRPMGPHATRSSS